jgi:ankyrin repeat protein
MMDHLIKAGASIHASNNNGVTALMLAAQSAYFDLINYLLKKDVRVNQTDAAGKTALHYLANAFNGDISSYNMSGHITTSLAYLLMHNADIDAIDSSGKKAEDYLIVKNYAAAVELIEGYRALTEYGECKE